MLVWFSYFSCDLINNLVFSYIFKKMNNIDKKLELKDFLLILTASIITSTIITTLPTMVRYLIKIFLMIITYKIIFGQKISETTISVLILYVLIIFSEVIFVTIFILLMKIPKQFLEDNYIGIVFTNLAILFIAYMISNLKVIKKLISYIIDWYNDKDTINVIVISMLAELTIGILAYQNYEFNNSLRYLLVCNIFLIGAIVFIVGYFKQRSDNGKLLHDYDNLLKYSKEYEKELITRSKNQHEYRNQLIVIDSMITGRNKDAKDYIKDLLNEPNYNEDFQVIEKLSFIQLDGLKGFIHFKIQEMLGHKINVFVDVSKQLEKKKLWKICNENLQDISRCLGVYLDNAMEATLSSKDKAVIVEIYLDEGHIVFSISNTYQDKVDFSKIDQEGYSSKGKNRGYGLSFVKEIIENNLYLNQKREVVGTYYIQKLFVQTK